MFFIGSNFALHLVAGAGTVVRLQCICSMYYKYYQTNVNASYLVLKNFHTSFVMRNIFNESKLTYMTK